MTSGNIGPASASGFTARKNLAKTEVKKKPKFYWDVVYQETVDLQNRREKMTKARAKNVLNVGDDERMNPGNVHRAFRKHAYPLELENCRAKNSDGVSQVDLHEAYQHLIKYAKPSRRDSIDKQSEEKYTEEHNPAIIGSQNEIKSS